jgi:hypothetical protein
MMVSSSRGPIALPDKEDSRRSRYRSLLLGSRTCAWIMVGVRVVVVVVVAGVKIADIN